MLTQPAIDAIIGTSATIGSIAYALHRAKLWKFSRGSKQDDNGNGNGSKSVKPCPLHNDMAKLVNTVKSIQEGNALRHQQHEANLKEGKEEFRMIREKLTYLSEGVAVLIDRTERRVNPR